MNSVFDLLQEPKTASLILLSLCALTLLLCFGWLWTALRLRTVSQRLAALTRGASGQNLEETLAAHLETVGHTTRRMDALEQAVGVLQAQTPSCLQKVGLVRYDAFEDVGGEQSFSVALLDGRDDGVILTGVFSRLDMRVYAKTIQQGRPSHTLSNEERRALQESVTL